MNIEQAKELKNTILWTELCKEIDTYITFEMSKLINCKPEELTDIQGRIKVWQSVKDIPDNVIDREQP